MTSDHASVDRALAGLEGLGATSMNDAIHVAMSLRPTDVSRPVIIVFSDGNDNLSWESAASLVDEAKKVAVVIHAIELRVGESPIGPGAPWRGDRRRGGGLCANGEDGVAQAARSRRLASGSARSISRRT